MHTIYKIYVWCTNLTQIESSTTRVFRSHTHQSRKEKHTNRKLTVKHNNDLAYRPPTHSNTLMQLARPTLMIFIGTAVNTRPVCVCVYIYLCCTWTSAAPQINIQNGPNRILSKHTSETKQSRARAACVAVRHCRGAQREINGFFWNVSVWAPTLDPSLLPRPFSLSRASITKKPALCHNKRVSQHVHSLVTYVCVWFWLSVNPISI